MKEPVSQTEVVRSWLARERRKEDLDLSDDPSDWELVGTLFARRPFQAAFVWRYPVTWYRTELDAATFRRLRVIEGPRDESWRKLSPDGTILGAARQIQKSGLRGQYEDIDVDHVRRLAEETPETERIVCFRRANATPYVADGNHCATARALALLREGVFEGDGVEERDAPGDAAYAPQQAYLGVRRYPNVE